MTEIGQGECRAGVLTCSNGVWSRCEGEQLAEPESCNGLDDNCDGRVDNAEVKCPETCDMSGRELCNDVDDDCDGETDENADQPCYTATTGCKRRPDGVDFMCAGLCAKGVRRCVDGKLEEPCIGQVGPRDEVCDSGGTALDEDCDGQTNEDCRCIGSQTQACYGGEMGTAMVGVCRMGRQVCAGSAFGECVGEQQPSEETCLNPGADDDCDGTPDDVPSLGIPCVPTEPGRAQCRGRLACVEGQRGPNPSCVPDTGAEVCGGYDEDCDGNIDEACPRGQGCCGTACVNLDEDRNNCGACRTRCDAGESCVDGDCRRNVAGEGGGGGGGMGGMSGTGGMGGGGMSGSGGQGGAAGEAGGGGAGGS